MEFSSDPRIGKAIGIIAGTISLVCLYASMFIAEGSGIVFLLLFAIVVGLVAVVAFSFKFVVSINKERDHLVKARSALFWSQRESIRLSEFKTVGIATGGRSSSSGGATIVYFVDVRGATNLKLPGASTDLAEIKFQAREVASYLGLPFDSEPAAAFFNRRL